MAVTIKEQIAEISLPLASFGKGSRLGHFTFDAVAEGPCEARLGRFPLLRPISGPSQPAFIQSVALMLQLTAIFL